MIPTIIPCLKCWVIGLLEIISKRSDRLGLGIVNRCYGIDKDRLYVTVFEGAKEDQLDKDQEAYDCWKLMFLKTVF